MAQETLLGSFVLRVLLHAQKLQYKLHDLRSGEIKSFDCSQQMLEHIKQSSAQHPPWQDAD